VKAIKKINECKYTVNRLRGKGYIIGFVPTMGFLHEGHLSLIRLAKKGCDKTIISIFVNPAQFGPGEDFKKYPRNIKRDSTLAEKEGVDYIFYPSEKEMYSPDHKTTVEVEGIDNIMCGRHRPGHFAGVATVVLKLFNIINAHKAYFGEKDYQQLVVIKKMVEDLNLDVKIIGGPTVREENGLAMSSRNMYLSGEERKNATILYKCLSTAGKMVLGGREDLEEIRKKMLKELKENEFVKKVDYFDFRDPLTLCEKKVIKKTTGKLLVAGAIWIGKTRLIDNIIIKI
jgi:pantoate--beta-alanine ligase